MAVSRHPKWKRKSWVRRAGKKAFVYGSAIALGGLIPEGATQTARLLVNRLHDKTTTALSDRIDQSYARAKQAEESMPEWVAWGNFLVAGDASMMAVQEVTQLRNKPQGQWTDAEKAAYANAQKRIREATAEQNRLHLELREMARKGGAVKFDAKNQPYLSESGLRKQYPAQAAVLERETAEILAASGQRMTADALAKNRLAKVSKIQNVGRPAFFTLGPALGFWAAYGIERRRQSNTKTVRKEKWRVRRMNWSNKLDKAGFPRLSRRVWPKERKFKKPYVVNEFLWGTYFDQEGIGLALNGIHSLSKKKQLAGVDLLADTLQNLLVGSPHRHVKELVDNMKQYRFVRVEGNNLVFTDDPKGAVLEITQ